ncbi:MAG: IS1 family transposase, partial [Holosporaceae bacterium]|nr:IS1 family transposase [Holosporaceae bacterium]
GDASSDALRRLWKRIEGENNLEYVCTDGNPSYAEVFEEDADLKRVVTKSETCLVESFNSILRYYLARLHRKTKCYSKSAEMLRLSVLMFLNKELLISL